jgi:SAM-dependent methyltransferase
MHESYRNQLPGESSERGARASAEAPRTHTIATVPPLAPDEDAYGRLLLAALEGRPSEETMERDDGLTWDGDPHAYFAPSAEWPEAEREALAHVRGRVLDVGCGAGRVALELQARGHDVVAIDESPLAVEVARRRGVRDARPLALADVTEELGPFDSILVARNNFGLEGDEPAASRALERFARLTAADGRVVTDFVHPGRDPDGHRGHRFRVRFGACATPWFRYLMLTPDEVERLLEGTDWELARVIDDGSPRYVVVLVKRA